MFGSFFPRSFQWRLRVLRSVVSNSHEVTLNSDSLALLSPYISRTNPSLRHVSSSTFVQMRFDLYISVHLHTLHWQESYFWMPHLVPTFILTVNHLSGKNILKSKGSFTNIDIVHLIGLNLCPSDLLLCVVSFPYFHDRLVGDGSNASSLSKVVPAQKTEPLTVSELNQCVLTFDPQVTLFLTKIEPLTVLEFTNLSPLYWHDCVIFSGEWPWTWWQWRWCGVIWCCDIRSWWGFHCQQPAIRFHCPSSQSSSCKQTNLSMKKTWRSRYGRSRSTWIKQFSTTLLIK